MAELLKYSDIKSWDNNTVDAKVGELRTEIFKMRIQKSTAGIEKPHSLKIFRKNIARLLTVKNAKK